MNRKYRICEVLAYQLAEARVVVDDEHPMTSLFVLNHG